jgi:hypothetical protein
MKNRYLTKDPIVLEVAWVGKVGRNHRRIVEDYSKDSTRIATGNAKSAVTKKAEVVPWAK